ncbi:MAG: hypothetical protein ACOH5I_24105 [Oligoflexus sp.]
MILLAVKTKRYLAMMFLVSGLITSPSWASFSTIESKQEDAGTVEHIQLAFEQLRDSEILESSRVGFAGSLSHPMINLFWILESPEAEELLLMLYDQGQLAAKMYAIIGMQILGQQDLVVDLVKDASQYKNEYLATMDGCIIDEQLVRDVLMSIRRGIYRQMFDDERQNWSNAES